MRKYLAVASARYERIRDIELAAMVAVKDLYLMQGFAVADVSRQRRIGFDLAIGHPSQEQIVCEVEVKGTDRKAVGGVAITDHEYAAAEHSARAGDRRWWLYAVTQARHPAHRVIHPPYAAHDVVPAWVRRVANVGAVARRPLSRRDQLPADRWES